MLRPKGEGTGITGGSSIRDVMELVGIQNGIGKKFGTRNPINNAKAVMLALQKLQTPKELA